MLDGTTIPGLQSLESLRWRLGLFGLAEDLYGKRVLDIGAWDGWFSFECERRGAQVVALDCVEMSTFLQNRALLGSNVEYLILDVDEITEKRLGRFDIVLFLGVLYHLRNPLSALEKIVEVSRDIALIESYVIPSEQRPIPTVMEFYEIDELGGQIDNWCGPSVEALLAMCRSAGFAEVELKDTTNRRASVVCGRRWKDCQLDSSAEPPHLQAAASNRSWEPRFFPKKDEYVCCFFRTSDEDLSRKDVFVEIDGFGVHALALIRDKYGGYQVNCLKPSGLDAGIHEVRLRTRSGPFSNVVKIAVADEGGQFPAASNGEAVANAVPTLHEALLYPPSDTRMMCTRFGTVTCSFRCGQNVSQTSCEISGGEFQAYSISQLVSGCWQANFSLDRVVQAGEMVRIQCGSSGWSGAVRLAAAR